MVWAPDYVTAAQLKEHLRINDDDDDAVIALAITTASRAIDDATNRQFGVVVAPEVRRYKVEVDYDSGSWTVPVDDFQTVTGLVVSLAGDLVTTYELHPENALLEGRPYTRLYLTEDAEYLPSSTADWLSVTALWGWSSVPVPIQQATLLQAARLVTRRNAPFGVAGSPEMGNELRLLAKLDPDVAVAVRGYKRPRKVG